MPLPLADLEPLRLLLPGLATYLVHSTVCAGVALLAVPRLRRAATRDGLWKLALVAPLLTTGLALALPGGAGWLALEAPVARPALDGVGGSLDGERSGPLLTLPPGVVPSAPGSTAAAPARARRAAPAGPAPATPLDPWGAAVALGLAGSALALGRLAWRRRRLARLLAARRPLREPRLRGLLPDGADLRWSEHPGLPGPVALGRREVCLPGDGWRALDDAELRAVLGHERAHLERRDPLVLGLVDALVALTVWQPLNRLLRARLVRDVELACDARAVRATGDPLGLARVLERFARRLGDPTPALPVPASMAPGPSALVQRVEHLLAGEHGPERRRTRALAALATGLVLGALACQGPAVRGEDPDADASEGEPLEARVEDSGAGPDAVGADDFFIGRGAAEGDRAAGPDAVGVDDFFVGRGDAVAGPSGTPDAGRPDAAGSDDFFVGRGAVEGVDFVDEPLPDAESPEFEGETVEFTDVTEEDADAPGLPTGTVLLHLDPDGHVEHMPWVPGTTLTEYADGMLAVLVERLDESNAADPDLESERIGGMVLRPNRVVLSLDPDMPFVHALRWMERMAQPKVGLHRISLRVTGSKAEPVVVDLPTDLHDLEVPVEEPEDGSEPPVTLPVRPTSYLTFEANTRGLEVSDPRLSGAANEVFLEDLRDRDRIRARFRAGEGLRPAGRPLVRLPENHVFQVSVTPGWSAEQVVPELWAFTQLLDPVRITFVGPLVESTPEGR